MRDFQIAGPVLARVKGGSHMSGGPIATLSELGLTSEPIRITPHFKHRDIHVDDYGPDVPAEVLWMLADANIRMTLVHYDADVLEICLAESMGGARDKDGVIPGGLLTGAGTPMGGYALTPAQGVTQGALQTSGCHYVSLNLITQIGRSHRFRACYLAEPPIELPLGVARSEVTLNWRAIPYSPPRPLSAGYLASGEITCSGLLLWDYTLDS